jgi:outer membrane protein TolC
MTRSERRRRAARLSWGVAAALALVAGSVTSAQETPAVPRVLRLEEAIRIALGTSNAVGSDSAQLFASRKARTASIFALGPDLVATGGYASGTRTDYDVPIDTTGLVLGNVDEVSSRRSGGISSSIRLFDGFANFARIQAAGQDVKADEYTLEYTRKVVEENVVSAYYNLLRAQLLLKVAEEGETVAREQLERTQALYDLGSAARSDVLKSQVQHGDTRLTLVRARNLERQSHVDLEYAMNLTTSVDFEIDTTVARIDPEQPVFEVERDYALENRENLLSLRHRETAADKRVWVARGALLPTVDFQYSFGRSRSTSQFRFGAADNATREWALFANWNIWDRYQNYANIAQAKANSRQAEYSRRQAELDAIREVRQLVNNMDEARERFQVATENVARSREDLRLAQEKFRVGAGTILDTITAESDLTQTRANEVQARVDFLIARANLARATGRDFSQM